MENEDHYRQDAPFVREWRAPSWSEHYLTASSFNGLHHFCTSRENTAVIAQIETETLSNGKVKSAKLIVRGKAVFVKVRSGNGAYRGSRSALTAVTSANTEYNIDSFAFNFDRLPQLPHTEQLTLVALSRCNCMETSWSLDEPDTVIREERPSIVALMLRRASTHSPTYNRAGVRRLQGDACKIYDNNVPLATEDCFLV